MGAHPIHFDFRPDPQRAEALDRLMHAELGGSLRHIIEQCRGHLAYDEAGMVRLIEMLESGHRVPAQIFADYYDLAHAVINDELGVATSVLHRLSQVRPSLIVPKLQVAALGDPSLGTDTDRFISMMNNDASLDLGFTLPSQAVTAAFRDRLDKALALMDAAIPDLAGEIRNIIRLVVICGSDPARTMQFDGGSHFQLWSAVFLNGAFHPDPIAVAEVLAHECAHSLLFGFCTDHPLTLNDEAERYTSPLRQDPRPMDGIYHATFVSARMHWAMSELAKSHLLTEAERDRARKAADEDLRNFQSGYSVVEAHGKLSEVGGSLMANAKAYIDSVL